MFVDRAQAARPGFELEADNALDVAEVCRTLDGLPLAIELAAARMGTMSAAQLRLRLADRFRVLRGGRRLAPARQQTLEALIDWSHDLLGAEEQVLLRRLGVFAGSFPAESAQAVAAWGELEAADIEDGLDGLAAKSLVVARPEQGRFVLLETLRAYARQRLERAGEMEEARDRHMGVMLERLERHQAETRQGATEAEALRAIDDDHADVLEGFAWATQGAEHGWLSLKFVTMLYLYYPQRGQDAFALEQARHALNLQDSRSDSPERAFALFVAGQYSTRLGLRSEAIRDLQDSLAMAQRLGLLAYEAMATNSLAAVMHEVGDTTGALVYAKRAVELAHQAEDDQEITNALGNFAMHLRGAHRLDEAQAALAEVLVRSRRTGRRSVTAVVLLNLAMVTLDRGKPDKTLMALMDVLPLLEALQSPMLAACLLDVVAALVASRGSDAAAHRLWAEADGLYAACGVLRDGPDAAFVDRWRSPATAVPADGRIPSSTASLGVTHSTAAALALAAASLKEPQARSTDPGSHTPSPAA
jgi:non-specific serine/threonine protein kinase